MLKRVADIIMDTLTEYGIIDCWRRRDVFRQRFAKMSENE